MLFNILQNKFDPRTVKCIIDFKDMLDGVFNPPAKRTTDDLDSDDEDDDEPDINPSEKNIETESVDMISAGNTETTANREKSIISEESENNTLVANQTTVVSPSAANMPTTFGSENNTNHRFLRKSQNLSRNNSNDSNSILSIDTSARPNKIRIEARIDSDKKSKDQTKTPVSYNSKTRRSLRYTKRNKNQSEREPDPSDPKPREPEITEKILNSPVKERQPCERQTPKKNHTEKTRTPQKEWLLENETIAAEKRYSKNSPLRQENRNNKESNHEKSAVMSTEEVIYRFYI